MTDLHRPTRPGFRLTPEGEDLFELYLHHAETRGCSCFLAAPCGICTHEGHPICIEESDEFWEPAEPQTIDFLSLNKEFSQP